MASAFQLRRNEDHLSVNWLERLNGQDLASAISQVRTVLQRRAYRLRPNGRFAILGVDAAKDAVSENLDIALRIEHLPLEDDESHAGIFGYAAADIAVAVELALLIADEDIYPTAV